MIILIVIFFLAVILIVVAWVLFVFFFTRRIFAMYLSGEAPFVPTSRRSLPGIVEALEIKESDVVYDLGCGDARVLVACYLHQPKAKYIGYEKDMIPYLWTKLRLWRMGLSKKIEVCNRDFFDEDLSEARKVFTYLVPRQMKKLEKKLEKEMRVGVRLVSRRFKLPRRIPLRNFSLSQEDLYTYEF